MKHYRRVFVKTNKNFRPRKKQNPYEWSNFVAVIRICKQNGFNVKSYIKYCFLNRLVCHGKGRAIQDISYLTHFPQISAYAKDKEEIEKLYAVYINILKTVLRIKKMRNESGLGIKQILNRILSSGQFANYLMTGVLSKNFVALIPNIDNYIYERTKNSHSEEHCIIEGLCDNIRKIALMSHKAMNMFWPEAADKSIAEICSE